MSKVEIMAAQKRETVGTRPSRRDRLAGRVPAIVYGHKEEPMPVTVDHDELEAALRHHSRMLDLKVGRQKERVLLREVQYNTFGTEIIHADFIRVAMDEVVRVNVPVVLHGHAVGEQHGGVAEQLLTTVAVECLPADIPEEIRVVITHLEVGQSVHVSDLVPPPGVKIATEASHLVLTIATPAKVVAEAEGEAEAPEEGEPEVIARGKEEEAEGGAEAAKDKGAET